MEVALPTLAETLAERRMAVHLQHLRSIALSDPRIIAGIIGKWLRDDGSGWQRPAAPRRPDSPR